MEHGSLSQNENNKVKGIFRFIGPDEKTKSKSVEKNVTSLCEVWTCVKDWEASKALSRAADQKPGTNQNIYRL